jgi:prevent-host-death family protein
VNGIGIRELKARASEILRSVRERRTRYLITYHGRPSGILLPLDEPLPAQAPGTEGGSSNWDELLRLGEMIGKRWHSEQTSAGLPFLHAALGLNHGELYD